MSLNDPEPEEPTTFIYAMFHPERGRCKIGRSNDPEKRRQNLQTGTGDDLSVVCERAVPKKYASKIEKSAQKIAEDELKKRKTREWFSDTTPDEAQYCVDTAIERWRGKNSKP